MRANANANAIALWPPAATLYSVTTTWAGAEVVFDPWCQQPYRLAVCLPHLPWKLSKPGVYRNVHVCFIPKGQPSLVAVYLGAM